MRAVLLHGASQRYVLLVVLFSFSGMSQGRFEAGDGWSSWYSRARL